MADYKERTWSLSERNPRDALQAGLDAMMTALQKQGLDSFGARLFCRKTIAELLEKALSAQRQELH